MKINKLLLPFVVAFSSFSCSSDELLDCEATNKLVKATITDFAHTKTSMGDGGKVLWMSGDDISLMLRFGSHNRYVVDGEGGTSSTDFVYDGSTAEIDLGIQLPMNYAVYPYNAQYSVSGEGNDVLKLKVDVSSWASQTYKAGTFEDDKAIMTAISLNTDLPFKNAFSLLNIQLSAEISGSYNVSSISIASKSNALNGEAIINMSDDERALKCLSTSADNKTNRLEFYNPVVLTKTPTNFYILVPANTYAAEDLTISVKGKDLMDNVDFVWSKTMPVEVACNRSEVTTLWKNFEAGIFSGKTEGQIN